MGIANQGVESIGDLTKVTRLVRGSDNMSTHHSLINNFWYYRDR